MRPAALARLDPLADAADAALRAAAPEAAVLADRALHRALVALADNRACQEAHDRLWDRIVVASPGVRGQDAARADTEHRRLLAAIAAGEGEEASEIARRHVLATLA